MKRELIFSKRNKSIQAKLLFSKKVDSLDLGKCFENPPKQKQLIYY